MPATNSNLQAELAAALACDDTLMRRPTVRALLGVGDTYLTELVKTGRLAPPLKLSHKVVRFRARDVKRFLAEQGAPAA